jgi:hypothetical protein
LKHAASPEFWACYRDLPEAVQALAIEAPDGLVWFWIGNHTDYERLLNQ